MAAETEKIKKKSGTGKGTTNNPYGRPKGIPNKKTELARAAIAKFVEDNASRLQIWLDKIADGVIDDKTNELIVAPNPSKAFELFQSVVEYHIPKLARTEHVGDGGGPVVIQATKLDEQL